MTGVGYTGNKVIVGLHESDKNSQMWYKIFSDALVSLPNFDLIRMWTVINFWGIMTQEIVLSMWYFWFSRILSAWSGGRGILKKMLSLCYSIVYYYNGAQRKGMSSSYRSVNCAGFDLAWFSTLSSKCLCVFGLCGAIYIIIFLLTSFSTF